MLYFQKRINFFFFYRNYDPGRRAHITRLIPLIGAEVATKLCFECPNCGTISILYHSPMNLNAYFEHHIIFRCKRNSSETSVSFLFM